MAALTRSTLARRVRPTRSQIGEVEHNVVSRHAGTTRSPSGRVSSATSEIFQIWRATEGLEDYNRDREDCFLLLGCRRGEIGGLEVA